MKIKSVDLDLLLNIFILFPEMCAIACVSPGLHTSKFTCGIYPKREVIVFSLLLCYYYLLLKCKVFAV